MKLLSLISAAFLLLPTSAALARNTICAPVTGAISQLTPDSSCEIVTKANIFPDLAFIGQPGTCFSSQLTGYLGNIPISGSVITGVTTIDLGKTEMVVASIMTLEAVFPLQNIKLGELYTQDVIVNPNEPTAREQLTMVGGTHLFKNGKGNFTVVGEARTGQTDLSGTICIVEP